ncbi:MAG TPA: DUF3465 domain-containing protein [Candidatus Saccharimonadales bacterium]|nr:DUF3465 domain-containing protein [Candidatus Saccharimonadales bacterium]
MRRAGLVLIALAASACSASTTPDNAAIEADYADHRSPVEVTADGTVVSILTDDVGPSGTHQRFIIRLAGAAQTVLVDNNVTIGQRVPVAADQHLVVHGEYVWNSEGGLIHFTHHDPAPAHEGGWIELNGVRYQ